MLRILVLVFFALACSAASAVTPDAAAPDGSTPAANAGKSPPSGKTARKIKKGKKGKQSVKPARKDESLTGSCVTTDIGGKQPCRDIGPTRVVAGSKKLPPKKAQAQPDQSTQVPVGIVVKTSPRSGGK